MKFNDIGNAIFDKSINDVITSKPTTVLQSFRWICIMENPFVVFFHFIIISWHLNYHCWHTQKKYEWNIVTTAAGPEESWMFRNHLVLRAMPYGKMKNIKIYNVLFDLEIKCMGGWDVQMLTRTVFYIIEQRANKHRYLRIISVAITQLRILQLFLQQFDALFLYIFFGIRCFPPSQCVCHHNPRMKRKKIKYTKQSKCCFWSFGLPTKQNIEWKFNKETRVVYTVYTLPSSSVC